VHYKKYEVRSRLFALKDPRLAEQVLAAFSGAIPRAALAAPAQKPNAAAKKA
jgi:hypothetical protein